jgi:hypothetical protein
MNKIFYLLLFLSIAGAGVLWWLLNSLPNDAQTANQASVPEVRGIVIQDQAPASAPTLQAEKVEDKAAEATGGAEAVPTVLSISSEPSGAAVVVDGEKVGTTPIERKLSKAVQKFRFELEGHEPVEREAPKEDAPGGGLMNWKIQLTKIADEAPAAQVLEDESKLRFMGPVGPAFVQIKAVDEASASTWGDQVTLYRKKIQDDRVFACRVDLGDKGVWVRYLVGPYAARAEAQRDLERVRVGLSTKDAFVTGVQTCLQ